MQRPRAGAVVDRTVELGAAVTRRRKDLGLVQADVAALAGCSERFVHTVEHGKPTVRLDKLLDVLAVLGLGLLVVPGTGLVTADRGASAGRDRS